MHFAYRGYLLIALSALLALAGTWTDDPIFASAWLYPMTLLLAGLAVEVWYVRGTQVRVRMRFEEGLRLGRPARGAFAFGHNRGRAVAVQYVRAWPAAFVAAEETRTVEVAAHDETADAVQLTPVRLGAGRLDDVPARLLGRLQLAWWTRRLPRDGSFAVAPDILPRGPRAKPGEAAGETPRRLPGTGLELLQLREYVRGDAPSRIDWKATARRGSLISREYSEAQHLEVLVVIDAGRASRVRAGVLDRLGLYANVAARLAEHAVTVEDRVGLLVYADRVLAAAPPDRGMRAVQRLRRSLERLESERGESNPVMAAVQVRKLLRHRGLVVWLTDLAEPARNEELAQALRALVPRHQPIVAAPHAAEIARLASMPAKDWRDPAVALAAREHRDRAQLQMAMLKQKGVVVIDEADDALDKAVFDAYLQLRRRRRV